MSARTLLSESWLARINSAIDNPACFAHRETAERPQHFRARAIAHALTYDDEELRLMGLSPPTAPTFTRAHEADDGATQEFSAAETAEAQGTAAVHRWRGQWGVAQIYENLDAVLHEGNVWVADCPPGSDLRMETPGKSPRWRPVSQKYEPDEPLFRTPALDPSLSISYHNRPPWADATTLAVATAVISAVAIVLAVIALVA